MTTMFHRKKSIRCPAGPLMFLFAPWGPCAELLTVLLKLFGISVSHLPMQIFAVESAPGKNTSNPPWPSYCAQVCVGHLQSLTTFSSNTRQALLQRLKLGRGEAIPNVLRSTAGTVLHCSASAPSSAMPFFKIFK